MSDCSTDDDMESSDSAMICTVPMEDEKNHCQDGVSSTKPKRTVGVLPGDLNTLHPKKKMKKDVSFQN